MARSARRAAGLIVLAVFLFAAQAQAATFTVGTTSDTAAGTACGTFPNGCSLRQLIEHENALAATPNPPDTIRVPAGGYTLVDGPLTVQQSLNIAGDGARTTTVEQNPPAGTPVARVFDIEPNPAPFNPTVTISGLFIEFGKTPSGGGSGGDILNNKGTLTLREDVIALGTATGGNGGGVSNQGGTLTVTHSLVEDNSSSASSGVGGLGGGIENFTLRFTAAHLIVDNSTIVSNTASAGGGGILTDCAGPCSSTTTITNSTIASNDGGTVASGPNGGGLLATQGTMSVLNTIVASNTVASRATASNCGGSLISSLGHNLESAADCGFTATGDFQNTNPQFLSGGVSDTGGNTDTIALAANSPAVDAVPSNASGCSGTDQRDVPRPQGPACDIGAYEQFEPVEGHQFSEILAAVFGTSLTINWGDGTSSAPISVDPTTGQVTGTHTYAEAGIYHGDIHYLNSDHQPSQTPFDVKVSDAPLSATPASVSAIAGESFSGPVATFSDGNPLASVADFSATINWGDGTPASSGTVAATAGGFVVSGTHTYATSGSYPTTISIADTGGSSATANGIATAGQVPTPVLTSTPPSIGGTTAAFTGSVNPDGLPTTAFFQFGLDPKYTGAGPLAFTQSTPAQAIGSDFTSHSVSASVSGLVPNALYHVRLVATNAAGTTFGPDVTFTTLKTTPPGSPALGKTFNLSPVSGVVLILVHGQLVPLTELQQIPKNTLIDALHGTLQLTTAVPGGTGGAHDAAAKGKKPKKAKTQSGTFGGAIFKLSQARNGLATLALVEGAVKGGPSFGTCKAQKAGDPTATTAAS
ncbi:MAG: choice-of-anchor Q domain-containing protein, partial [Solirubrobacteraceae bacterium]